MSTDLKKPTTKDWINLIEKIILAILAFLTGTQMEAATRFITNLF